MHLYRGGQARARSLAAAVALAAVVAACGDSKPAASSVSSTPDTTQSAGSTTAAAGGTLNFGLSTGSIDTLDPNRWYFVTTWGIGNITCTTLLRYADVAGPGGLQLVAGLAAMPQVSADGKTYTLQLQPGAKFSSGAPVTPADIKYTFERLTAPDVDSGTGGYFSGIVGEPDYVAGNAADIAGITTTADSVVFALSQPDGAFPYKLAIDTACPVPAGTPKKPVEDASLLQTAATGPYMVKSYTPKQELDLVRNPSYAAALGDRGKVDEIKVDLSIDASAAGNKIKAGDIDLYGEKLSPADATLALGDATLKARVFSNPEPATIYLWLNNDVAPFDNPKVRQAINFAIDRTQIQRVWGGPATAVPTDQIMPPTTPGYKDYDAYPMTPDVAKAKQLLTDAGVTAPISTVLRTRDDAPGFREIAQVVQANLAAIGIKVEIKTAPDSVNYGIIKERKNKIPMGINQWSQDYPDGQSWIDALLDPRAPDSEPHFARFHDTAYTAELDRMATLNGTERADAYMALDEKIMREAAPWAPLLNPIKLDLVSAKLEGYTFSAALDSANLNVIGKTAG